MTDKFDISIHDYLFQVLIEGKLVSEFIYISAPNLNEAREKFSKKMKEDHAPGEWCLIGVYRKIS